MSKSVRGDYPSHDAQFFYEYVRDRLASQREQITAIDDKIVQLFTVSTALLAILAAVYALSKSFGAWEIAIGVASLLAFGVVADRSFDAYRPIEWKTGPNIRQVWDRMFDEDDHELIRWDIANRIWKSHAANLVDVEKKADALPWIFRGVLLQATLVIVALVLVAV